MRQFLRVLRYSWPYRFRLLGSVACALLVAALWSLNLSAIYPVLNILQNGKNLHQWVDGEIEEYQKKLDKLPNRKLNASNAETRILPELKQPPKAGSIRKLIGKGHLKYP